MQWNPTWEEFEKVVNRVVDEYTLGCDADISLGANDDVLKHSKLFIRDALTFWVFSDAIRHEDVGTMWLIYTFWLFMFRGAGCHNYGNEILEMTAQFKYEMEEPLQRIAERTWLVNRWGKPGRSIPTDRYLEHNNGFIKVRSLANFGWNAHNVLQNLFSAAPSCMSMSYVREKGSGPVELLRKLSRDVATYFNVTDVNRKHSEVSKGTDIKALAMDLKDSRVHTLVPGRLVAPTEPVVEEVGSKKKKKKRGIVDIFTEGKEALESSAFRKWKDRTGKLGADVLGCDPEFRSQCEMVMGQQGVEAETDAGNWGDDRDEIEVEFDALVDLENAGEI